MMGTPALERITVGGLLRRTAKVFPDNIAVECGDVSLSYSQLDLRVDLFAKNLLSLGVKKGDHVGIFSETSIDSLAAMYAAVRIGAVACLINTCLKGAELCELIKRSDIDLLLTGAGCADESLYESVRKYFADSALKINVFNINELDLIKSASQEDLEAAEAAVLPEDTAFILYTSGTTGPAKPVMDSHFSRANCGIMQAADIRATEKDVFLCALPTFHCFSLSVNVMASCAVGARLYIPGSRHTEVLLDAVQEKHCTLFSCVPTLFRAVIRRKDLNKWDVSSLRAGYIGGGTCSPQLFREIEDKLGMTLLSGLGQTEATGGISVSDPDDNIETRANSLGHFASYIQGCIKDPEIGNTLSTGQIGEICIKGYLVMKGYYGMPETTAQVIDSEGWLHTGDMGWIDNSGYLHLSGRLKDVIIRGGENISPSEIESVFSGDKRVRECRAIGIPDEHYGETIVLCINPEDGESISVEEIKEAARNCLADYKVPEHVLFFKRFPKNQTGKVLVSDLRQEAVKMI